MGVVWHTEFGKKFSQFGESWELIPFQGSGEAPEHYDGWYEDTAKIRFMCRVSDKIYVFLFFMKGHSVKKETNVIWTQKLCC